MLRRVTVVIFALAAFALIAACGPPWTVIEESGPPSALKGVSALNVNFDTTDAMFADVPIEQHRQNKKDWDELQAQMDQNFVDGLVGRLDGVAVSQGVAPPLLTVRWVYFHPGGGFSGNTIARARLVFTVDGKVTDEIETEVQVKQTIYRPAASQRLRVAAKQLGEIAAKFFNQKRGE